MTQAKYLTAIYPGTFDPITKGHLHLIQRASGLVDNLIIGVADNKRKNPLFTADERLEMVQMDIDNLRDKQCTMEVRTFSGLLVEFARDMKASCIFRGLRAISDFEFEFQMTGMNAKLDPELETLFLMASDKWQFVSSSFTISIVISRFSLKKFSGKFNFFFKVIFWQFRRVSLGYTF